MQMRYFIDFDWGEVSKSGRGSTTVFNPSPKSARAIVESIAIKTFFVDAGAGFGSISNYFTV